MSRRAVFMVTIAGTNITAPLLPVLISLTVSDKVGTHADTASLDIDDTDGRIVLPQIGAPVIVALGWEGGGVRVVFTGTVDEVRSSGSRGGGRTLSISAKGVDTTGKAKEPQQRHFDHKTVEDILKEAGSSASITEVEVDPALARITRTYFEMRDESFIHMGERLAREIGGLDADRAEWWGRPILPDAVDRIAADRDKAGLGGLANGLKTADLGRGHQPWVVADAIAGPKAGGQPLRRRVLDEMLAGERLRVHMGGGLQRVAAIDEQRGGVRQDDRGARRPGEPGEPGQALGGGRQVLALVLVGMGDDEAGETVAPEQRPQPL